MSDEFLVEAEEKAVALRAETQERDERWERIRAAAQAGAIPPPDDQGFGELRCPICSKKLQWVRQSLERWYYWCDCGYEYAQLIIWTPL